MTNFIFHRSLRAIIILFVASIIIFTGLRVAPGSVETSVINPVFASEGYLLENLRERLGLNQPLYVQYGLFMKNILTGNLGVSLVSARPIAEIIGEATGNTLKLAAAAAFLIYAIAIPLGVLAAYKRNSIIDHGSMILAVLGMGIPNFFLAILLIQLFSIRLGWLPVAGHDTLKHLILPAVALAAESLAITLRLQRSSLLAELGREYVRTLRAKGLSEWRIIWIHCLRNALPPVMALGGVIMRTLLGYTLIVEIIFRWPGLGSQLVDSILKRDFTLAQVLALLLTVAVVFFNLLADIGQQVVDPKIREQAQI